MLDRVVEQAALKHPASVPDRTIEVAEGGTLDVFVNCVETYVEQILQNLLSNAEKYSPDSAPIIVSIDQSHDVANVRVRDSGNGSHPNRPRTSSRRTTGSPMIARLRRGLALG